MFPVSGLRASSVSSPHNATPPPRASWGVGAPGVHSRCGSRLALLSFSAGCGHVERRRGHPRVVQGQPAELRGEPAAARGQRPDGPLRRT